jgi:hypothetical protein
MPDEKVEPAKIDPATLTSPAIDFEEMKLWPSQQPTTKPVTTKPVVKPVVIIRQAAKPAATTKPAN